MIMTRGKRPKIITLLACILILGSLYCFINVIAQRSDYRQSLGDIFRSNDVIYLSTVLKVSALLWLIAGGTMGIISGIAILKGLNWGRLLYLYYVPVLTISFILIIAGTGRFKSGYVISLNILAIAFCIITVIFLTRSSSLVFFTRRNFAE